MGHYRTQCHFFRVCHPSRRGPASRGEIRQFERHPQCLVQFVDGALREGADEVGERRFGQAHELVAVNAALLLESVRDTDRHLGTKSVMARIDRSADDGIEGGIDESLAADDHEDAKASGIVLRRLRDPVQIAALHEPAW